MLRSLVGSEMCIRDSLEIVRRLLDFSVELDSCSYNDIAPMEPSCGDEDGGPTELAFGHTALHWALQECKAGDSFEELLARKAEVAKVLIQHGADADALSATGQTAWHMAALHKQLVPVAEDLEIYGKLMRSESFPIGELLCLSAKRGNVELITFLRMKGFTLDELNRDRCTALYCAAEAGHNSVVQYLGDKGANLGATCGDAQQTPLHAAALNNKVMCGKTLATLGANLEVVDVVGQHPLHTAAKAGHGQVVEMLLVLKAEVDTIDKNGATPYALAAQEGHHDVAVILSKAGAEASSGNVNGQQAIHLAASNGKLALVEFALDKGAPVDVMDGSGRTALLLAAANGHLDLVEFLSLFGASVNVVDCNKQTPLHHAAMANHPAVVHHLCENGSCVDAKDCWSRTPLYLAAKHNNPEIVRLLLDASAQPDVATEEKPPDLPVALDGSPAESGDKEQSEGVGEQQGEELSSPEGLGEEEAVEEVAEEITSRAAIHVACAGLHVEVVEMLAAGGAEVENEADDGLTPIQTAVMTVSEVSEKEDKIVRIINVLVEYGAALTATDMRGRTAQQNANVLGLRTVRNRLQQIGELNSSIELAMTVKR
eukprot:TRINITY_DN5376_c0_g1_i3.p1 TRINITY_DN5376_c0_g1~~TRINITY_DN5376_c0_g1_i3.p1  ORF type:complete len:600 (+),score=178.83 TRINITY_DN5376_c0_g1_i3:146-1945(+)